MAHYAKVLNGKVLQVIVAEAEFFETFVDSSPGNWIQTSYNTRGGVHYDPNTGLPSADQSKALRKNYASIGMEYDSAADAFRSVQPFPSWTLNNETFIWECPEPYPTGGKCYYWNEPTLSWVEQD
jgi:hypothetical protein